MSDVAIEIVDDPARVCAERLAAQASGGAGEGRAAADRLRRRTTSVLQGLRIDAGRLAGVDPTAG